MNVCKECGYVIADATLVLDENLPSKAMRVFCPAHDMHDARYMDGRPLLDDKCPLCENARLREALEIIAAGIHGVEEDGSVSHASLPDSMRIAKQALEGGE